MKKIYSSEITLENIMEAVPKARPRMAAMLKKVKKDREKREKMSESEKFALNLPPDCTLEEEVFLKLGLKTVSKNGKILYTAKGMQLVMGVTTVLQERKYKSVEKNRKMKAKKRRKQEKMNRKRNKK